MINVGESSCVSARAVIISVLCCDVDKGIGQYMEFGWSPWRLYSCAEFPNTSILVVAFAASLTTSLDAAWLPDDFAAFSPDAISMTAQKNDYHI